ncbi:MAG: hypothetical protein NZM12_03530, partial [Steroidobacteraceae bacterium]|nr:hypothetical protein [Steroidobacteraceae bacterium]MDW8258034.1 hypothetical protein [Gammaproteobacteria bacterium]
PIGGDGAVLSVDLDGNYQSKRFLEDDNTAWLDSYWMANLRVTVERDRWSGTFYVDNLTDDLTIKSGGTGPAVYASDFRLGSYTNPTATVVTRQVFAPSIPTTVFADLPKPRVIGLRLNYRF